MSQIMLHLPSIDCQFSSVGNCFCVDTLLVQQKPKSRVLIIYQSTYHCHTVHCSRAKLEGGERKRAILRLVFGTIHHLVYDDQQLALDCCSNEAATVITPLFVGHFWQKAVHM